MMTRTVGKTHYSVPEAATALGITVEQLHSLIRNHIVEREEDLRYVAKASLQPADLLILKLLRGSEELPSTAH